MDTTLDTAVHDLSIGAPRRSPGGALRMDSTMDTTFLGQIQYSALTSSVEWLDSLQEVRMDMWFAQAALEWLTLAVSASVGVCILGAAIGLLSIEVIVLSKVPTVVDGLVSEFLRMVRGANSALLLERDALSLVDINLDETRVA